MTDRPGINFRRADRQDPNVPQATIEKKIQIRDDFSAGPATTA